MGPSRKRKKEEKAKTQLKKPKTAPGKHLPKGTNVTKTEFRVAKIVIPGQLGNSTQKSGPITTKKLGLKDVLSKLSHFSLTVRTDGLEGLKELLSLDSCASMVNANLAFILTSLVPVTQDNERKLRRLAISLLPLILDPVSPSLLAPLHSLLSAHLCCSLTHIDPRIQQDGLTMLDTLLDKSPDFIRSNYTNLLPNCLDQISNKKGSGKGPSVATNMSENMTALEWRVLVLTRVDKMLDTVMKDKGEASTTVSSQLATSVSFQPGMFCSLANISAPSWLPLSTLTTKVNTSSMLTNLKLMMPLLLETWVEARANETNSKKGSVLTSEVGDLLLCEAGVMDKLVMLALDNTKGGDNSPVMKLIKQKYLADIQRHFLLPLPYTSQGKSCDQANAILCCLSLAINEVMDASLLDVMVGVCASRNILACTRIRLSRQLLTRGELTIAQRDMVVVSLVKVAETNVSSEKIDAMNLLKDQAVKWPQSGVTKWLENLPSQLINNEDEEQLELVLNTCLELAKTCNKTLARKFLSSWPVIQGSLEASKQTSHLKKFNFIKHHCDIAIGA